MSDAALPVDPRPTVIRLGQFLKIAGLASSGGEAKMVIADGLVTVNGEIELRRRRQLKNGDAVAVGDERAVVDLPEDGDALYAASRHSAMLDGEGMDD